MLTIITQKLADHLPSNHKLMDNKVIDGSDFQSIFQLYHQENPQKVTIIDATSTKMHHQGELIPVKDHINKTGKNILIPLRKNLEGEFFDLSQLYAHHPEGVITTCCGDNLNDQLPFPSYHLCHFSVLASAMRTEYIQAYLYNTHNNIS